MTNQVSKSKLRRLPYEVRLNMIKHQNDFFDEIKLLIKDHPGREHPVAEDIIIEKATTKEIIDFLRTPGINAIKVCKGLCDRLLDSPPGISLILIRPLRFELPQILTNIKPKDTLIECLDMLTDTYLKINEKERQTNDWSFTGIDTVMALFDKMWYHMDYNKIADGLLPYLGNDTIYKNIKKLYERIDDKEFRSRIVDAIQIHDIIT